MNLELLNTPIHTVIILVLIYSFIGWLSEVIYAYYKSGQFINRGFLYGPLCPIYGVAITTIVLLLEPVKDNIVLIYLYSFVIITSIEYITSYVLEKLFQSKWWDYSDNKFNLKGRVCAFFSMMWGFAGVLIYKVLHPLVLKLLAEIPESTLVVLAYIGFWGFLLDFSLTIKSLIDLHRISVKLDELLYRLKTEAKLEKFSKLKEVFENYTEFDKKLRLNHKRLLKSFPSFKKNRFENLVENIKAELSKFRNKE